jgi:hypothetical protein
MASLTTTAAAAGWLLEGAGAAFQHVLTASTVTYISRMYDQAAEHCPNPHIGLRTNLETGLSTDSQQAIGGGPRGR